MQAELDAVPHSSPIELDDINLFTTQDTAIATNSVHCTNTNDTSNHLTRPRQTLLTTPHSSQQTDCMTNGVALLQKMLFISFDEVLAL